MCAEESLTHDPLPQSVTQFRQTRLFLDLKKFMLKSEIWPPKLEAAHKHEVFPKVQTISNPYHPIQLGQCINDVFLTTSTVILADDASSSLSIPPPVSLLSCAVYGSDCHTLYCVCDCPFFLFFLLSSRHTLHCPPHQRPGINWVLLATRLNSRSPLMRQLCLIA